MRGLVTVLLAVITGMFCSFVTYLPFIGDVNSAPNQHVTPVYIERSVQDTGSPNIVTGLLADYRGFDTMWEYGDVSGRSDSSNAAEQQHDGPQTGKGG